MGRKMQLSKFQQRRTTCITPHLKLRSILPSPPAHIQATVNSINTIQKVITRYHLAIQGRSGYKPNFQNHLHNQQIAEYSIMRICDEVHLDQTTFPEIKQATTQSPTNVHAPRHERIWL